VKFLKKQKNKMFCKRCKTRRIAVELVLEVTSTVGVKKYVEVRRLFVRLRRIYVGYGRIVVRLGTWV
jgi:hypothetical protein